MAEVFLTPNEVAKRLRSSARTLERKRIDGTGPPFLRFGRRVLYRADDIDEWSRAQVVRSTAEAEAR